jgi:hypothetical protein
VSNIEVREFVALTPDDVEKALNEIEDRRTPLKHGGETKLTVEQVLPQGETAIGSTRYWAICRRWLAGRMD